MNRRTTTILLAAMGLLGCGRLLFEGQPELDGGRDRDAGDGGRIFDAGLDARVPDGGRDAGRDSGSIVIDAGVDAGNILEVMFDPPTRLDSLVPFDADDPSLTADLLEIFFNASGTSTSDIFHATRTTVTDPFSAGTLVTQLSSPTNGDTSPEVSADGLTILFSSNRSGGGGGGYDLWISTRPARDQDWVTPVALGSLGTSTTETNPTVRPGSLRMVFVRGAITNGFNMHEATRATVGDPFVDLGAMAINSTVEDGGPMTALSGLVLYFHSQRSGSMGRDLYMATRANIADEFSNVMPIAEMNTAGDEQDIWISEDGHTMFFSRDGELQQTQR